jgi:hypothetical protein
MSTGAAIGAGVGGLAALAALALLFILLKRRKKPEGPLEEETTVDDTMTEVDDYISEYGLSDGRALVDDVDGVGEDQPVMDPGNYESDQENISERNPEDFENGADEM